MVVIQWRIGLQDENLNKLPGTLLSAVREHWRVWLSWNRGFVLQDNGKSIARQVVLNCERSREPGRGILIRILGNGQPLKVLEHENDLIKWCFKKGHLGNMRKLLELSLCTIFFKLIDCQELVYLNTLFSDLYLEELTQFFHLITFKFSETAV